MNAGDSHLSNVLDHLIRASILLHELVGTRDIEVAIACCKTAQFLVERAQGTERDKRHLHTRDEIIDHTRTSELFKP